MNCACKGIGPDLSALGGGGGTPGGSLVSKTVTANYSIEENDRFIFADPTAGSFNITLQEISTIGNAAKEITIIKVGTASNFVNFVLQGSDQIEDGGLPVLKYDYEIIKLTANKTTNKYQVSFASANVLRDFTPNVTGTNGLTVNMFTTKFYKYKIIGNLLFVHFTINNMNTSGTGLVDITLPFPTLAYYGAGDAIGVGNLNEGGTIKNAVVLKANPNSMRYRDGDGTLATDVTQIHGIFLFPI